MISPTEKGQKVHSLYQFNAEECNSFFQIALDIVCIAGLDGSFIRINPAVERILGYTPEDIESKKFFEFVHPEDLVSTHREVSKVSKGIDTIYFENRFRHKDNSYRWFSWTCPAVPKDSQKLYAVGRDITGIKRMEIKLRESEAMLIEQKESLREKNIAIEQVLEQIQLEKNNIKADVINNVKTVLLPTIEKIKLKCPDNKYIHVLRSSLEDMTSKFGSRVTYEFSKLSNREVEISNMVKNGLTNKEIASLLSIALHTVEKHRLNIRKKLNITNEGINLAMYLKNL